MIKNPQTEYSKREKFKDKFGGTNNEVYTPEEAIYPLLPYLKKEQVIWDCAFGSGRLAKHFKKYGFKVVGFNNLDFLEEVGNDVRNLPFDIIITNPPYSFKDNFLEKAFKIGKPFAFLLPLSALGAQKRVKMYKEYGIQLIVPDKRINFEIPSGKKSNWFHTAWFCWKLNLPKDLNFVELGKKQNKNKFIQGMKFEFGVMSCKYELEAEDLKVAKLAMTLFIGKPIPIAIYNLEKESFIPSIEFMQENIKYKPDKVNLAYKSIKKLK